MKNNFTHSHTHTQPHPFKFEEQSTFKNITEITEMDFYSTVKSMSLLFVSPTVLSKISIMRLSSEKKERKRNTEQQEVYLWITAINILITGLLPTADRHQRHRLQGIISSSNANCAVKSAGNGKRCVSIVIKMLHNMSM